MSQFIVIVSKSNIGDVSKRLFVVGFASIEAMHADLSSSGIKCDIAEFSAKLSTLPFHIDIPNSIGITIEFVLRFDNVPFGRDVIEIVSAIYYAATRHELVEGMEIKRGPAITDVLVNPKEVLNPAEFDWNIPKFTRDLSNVFLISVFLDFDEEGETSPSSQYIVGR